MARKKKKEENFGITEYFLPNGLRVLYKRIPTAPVVAVCITFHVGSRNEAPGHTGATHILEHLLFKDSKHFNRKNGKAITDYLEWFGAYINATTWLDRTNYFELLPRERLPEALALEADRMRGSLFSDNDLASEMTVVRNEYERSRNNPFELLDEEVMATAFVEHPYRIPTIGLKADIEGSTAKKLREFYDTFYWPNNATLGVFGDVSLAQVKKLVQKEFGKISPSPHHIKELEIIEPEQDAPRSVELRKPGEVSIASLSYKIPRALDADFPALLVLATMLSGGFSSRMQKTIVDQGLAAEVYVSTFPLHDPGIMSFVAHVAEGVEPYKVVEKLRAEVRRIAKSVPPPSEVKRAQEQILAQAAYERDGALNEIRVVSEATAAGDWRLAYSMPAQVKKVRPRDIVRVAKKYLAQTQETSGVLIAEAQ